MEKDSTYEIWEECFQNTPFAIFILDETGKFENCNKSFLINILGNEHLCIKGKSEKDFKQVFSAEYIQSFQNVNKQLINYGGNVNQEVEVKSANGVVNNYNEYRMVINHQPENKTFIAGFLTKIYGRKKQWDKLSQNNALLTALLANSSDLIYFKDVDSRFIKVSKTFVKRLDMELKDLIGKTDFDLFGKVHATEAFLDEQIIMQTRESIIGKEEHEDWADGKETWVSTSKMPLYGMDGKIIGTFGISRDITRQKADALYKQNSLVFFTLLSTVSALLLKHGATNFDFALDQVLEELCNFFKCKKSYAYYLDEKKNVIAKVKEYPLDTGSEAAYGVIAEYKNWYEKLKMGDTVFDQRITNDSPEQNYLEENKLSHIIIIPLMNYMTLAGFISFECDDTSVMWPAKFNDLFKVLSEIISNAFLNSESEKYRIEAEEEMLKLLRAVNQSKDIIAILNQDATIEYVNFRYTEITGYPYEDVIQTKFNFFTQENNAQYDYEKILASVMAGSSWDGKYKQTIKNGKTIWTQLSLSPLKSSRGEISNILVIMEEITEKMIEESRKAVSQKLESIGQLAAGIAHEINTPMQFIGDNTTFLQNSIIPIKEFISEIKSMMENETDAKKISNNYNSLLEKYDIEFMLEELPQAIKQTLTGIQHVSKIVKAMKDFSHPGEREKSYADINHGIEVTVTISKNEWKYVAELELKLNKELPEVFCHQDELNQVVLGMIINAAHAIEEKKNQGIYSSGKIIIETYQENSNAVIRIKDNGMGIKEENQAKIFDPFFTTKDVGKGTGQGLTIAHDLVVNKHGGTLDVKSKYGEGTVFTIKIPIESSK